MTSTTTQPQVLSDALLAEFARRAPLYDAEHRFFQEDFDDLRATGYLSLTVPRELGGGGLTLEEYARELRRLAYHAPATALGTNMHHYWVGLCADLYRAGDHSMEWLLREALAGEVFAAGHAEPGNDIPVLLSTTRAERVDGGYRFTGRKSFGSLSPVWTRLGLHGLDTSDPTQPKVVHAFMSRDAADYRIDATWDVLGMRATQSDDTILDGVFVPDDRIARVLPAGFGGADAFALGVFAWALIAFGNVYFAIARRALDETVALLNAKKSIAVTRTMAYHPEAQHAVAEMALELDAIEAHLDRVAADWSSGVDHGALWASKILSAKYHAVEGSWRVVDRAFDLGGGFGIFRRSGLERMFRDARLGRIHPGNSALTHEIVGKLALGIHPDEQPRWG